MKPDSLSLLKRATTCEKRALTYDISDPYKAGVYSGQAQILNEWARSLNPLTEKVSADSHSLKPIHKPPSYRKWYDFLFLFHPICWFRARPYSKDWDKQLNDMMDRYRFIFKPSFRYVMLGDEFIILNCPPYRYFCEYASSGEGVLPSRLTIIRAVRKLKDELGIYHLIN